jgi:hypothetical protein
MWIENSGDLVRQVNKGMCNAKIPRNSSKLRLIIDAIDRNCQVYHIPVKWHQHVQGSVHGNRPVWNKTQNRGYFKYRVRKERFATVTSLQFSAGFFMVQTESEMMLRLIILWCNLVRVIQVWEADLRNAPLWGSFVKALGPRFASESCEATAMRVMRDWRSSSRYVINYLPELPDRHASHQKLEDDQYLSDPTRRHCPWRSLGPWINNHRNRASWCQ